MKSACSIISFLRILFALLLVACAFPGLADFPSPPVTLAKIYGEHIDISRYWVSEKLDGVRAYWDGEQLLSRQGNHFAAPDWFTAGFPDQPLDGELWLGRNRFQALMSIVKDRSGDPGNWQQVRYCVFDLPVQPGNFSQRLLALQKLLDQLKNPYLKLVKQFRVRNQDALMQELDAIMAMGGEGLMLHRADALHEAGRSGNLLKLKRYEDAEATVAAHLPGKGKYQGMLGALLVEGIDGLRFRIGTGFSDAERLNPPPVGTVITYKYYGKTRRGIPRFASFIRIREPE
jgi:DNA ligase-1